MRKQFGQFIGQFQAIQHKLADCLINLDGARLAIEAAADAFDRADPAWRVFANAAIAFAGPAVRRRRLKRTARSVPSAMPRSTRLRATSGASTSTSRGLAACSVREPSLPTSCLVRPRRSPGGPHERPSCRRHGSAADAFREEIRDWLAETGPPRSVPTT